MKKFGKRISPTAASLSWERRKLMPGEKLRAWAAGPVVGVATHWCQPHSKPCLSEMSDGALECPRCKAGSVIREIGYWPMIDECRAQIVVILSATSAGVAQNIAHGTCVELSRGSGDRDRVNIRHLLTLDANQTISRHVAQREPADITDWLFKLWKESTLAAHWKALAIKAQDDAETLPVNTDLMRQILAGGIDRTAGDLAAEGKVSK